MRASTRLLSKSFVGRSLDEFKRLSGIALKAEGTRVPTKPYILNSFTDASSLSNCKLFSDEDQGGFSRANLDFIPPVTRSTDTKLHPSQNENGNIRFHGTISPELPVDRPDIQRSGYAAWRTQDRGWTLFGRSLWDIDAYVYLALRIKSDGRKYFVNVQTESIVPTDLHQHRLYAKRPGEWETVLIRWSEFVRTNHGVVIEPQSEMLRQKVRTIGIGLIDRVPGKFDLSIESMWATTGSERQDGEGVERLEHGHLKNRHGEKIKWNMGDNKSNSDT